MLGLILVPMWYAYRAKRNGRNPVAWGSLGLALYIVAFIILKTAHATTVEMAIVINVVVYAVLFVIPFLVPSPPKSEDPATPGDPGLTAGGVSTADQAPQREHPQPEAKGRPAPFAGNSLSQDPQESDVLTCDPQSVDELKRGDGNTSGRGPASVVPPEIQKWNWGAFLLSWIWGIGNRTYIALLTLVPIVGFIMVFVLGAKGSEWAWRNKQWDGVEQFRRVQRQWGWWGLGALVLCVMFVGIAVAIGISTFNASAQMASRDQVVADLENLASAAHQYYRKPQALGGGQGSFVGFTISDRGDLTGNGKYLLADEIPPVSDWNPAASRSVSNPASFILVGWGNETGKDGIHKVEVCASVTPDEVHYTVIN